MPPRGKGQKRTYKAASFVDELRREIDSSLAAQDGLLGAFRVLCSTKLTSDSIRDQPSKVISARLSAACKAQVVSYVSLFLKDLQVLPFSVRLETTSKLTGISVEEASLLFEGLTIVNKSLPVHNGIDLAEISGVILMSY